MNYYKLLAFFFAIYFYSCSSAVQEKQVDNRMETSLPITRNVSPEIPKGKLVNRVVCLSNSSQTYAAYLPSTYDSLKKYPVIFAFDAHAGGRIPIELYKELAEKYGYILLASNNSKNGLSSDEINTITTTFLQDAKARFAFDPRRIYLLGFSGGARVAANLAMQGGFAGLASCSAGFQANGELSFNFIGFAGTSDFNSNEMVGLNKSLDLFDTKHQLILFEGKHEWPKADVFENAFLWFEFNAMTDKMSIKNDALIKNFAEKEWTKVEFLQAKEKWFDAYTEATKSINFLKGLSDCSNFISARNKLGASSGLKKIFLEKDQLATREAEIQNYYRQAIQEKDLTWWNQEVDRLQAESKSKKNTQEEHLFYKRTLSFLSLMSYLAANSMLNQNQLSGAAMYLQLYEKVDPENSEVYYLQAVLAAKQQNNQAILPLLQRAIGAGFTDAERLKGEELFSVIRQSPEYAQLITKIEAAK